MQKVKEIDNREAARKESQPVDTVTASACSSSSAQDYGSDNEGSTDMQVLW